jgi:hypothetical protein
MGTAIITETWFDRYVDTLHDAAKLDLYHVLVSGDREAIRAQEQKIEEMAVTQLWPRKWHAGHHAQNGSAPRQVLEAPFPNRATCYGQVLVFDRAVPPAYILAVTSCW